MKQTVFQNQFSKSNLTVCLFTHFSERLCAVTLRTRWNVSQVHVCFSCVHPGKKLECGGPCRSKLEGYWTNFLSVSFKMDQSDYLTARKQVGNGVKLPVGVLDNTARVDEEGCLFLMKL